MFTPILVPNEGKDMICVLIEEGTMLGVVINRLALSEK
jgi:hypothetical protein